jgi:hypothetical protein
VVTQQCTCAPWSTAPSSGPAATDRPLAGIDNDARSSRLWLHSTAQWNVGRSAPLIPMTQIFVVSAFCWFAFCICCPFIATCCLVLLRAVSLTARFARAADFCCSDRRAYVQLSQRRAQPRPHLRSADGVVLFLRSIPPLRLSASLFSLFELPVSVACFSLFSLSACPSSSRHWLGFPHVRISARCTVHRRSPCRLASKCAPGPGRHRVNHHRLSVIRVPLQLVKQRQSPLGLPAFSSRTVTKGNMRVHDSKEKKRTENRTEKRNLADAGACEHEQ